MPQARCVAEPARCGVAPLGGFQRRALRETVAEAVRTYEEGVYRLARDDSSFLGISGGRSHVMEAVLAQRTTYAREVLGGSGWEALVATGAEEEAERPGQRELPFRSDRMAVPERGADFPLLEWIPASWRRTLERPDELLVNRQPEGKCPKSYYRVGRREWLKYLKKTGSAGMTVCFLLGGIPRGPEGEDLSSGVFPVGKDRFSDRTIVDRRRKNWAERPWEAPRLPHGG